MSHIYKIHIRNIRNITSWRHHALVNHDAFNIWLTSFVQVQGNHHFLYYFSCYRIMLFWLFVVQAIFLFMRIINLTKYWQYIVLIAYKLRVIDVFICIFRFYMITCTYRDKLVCNDVSNVTKNYYLRCKIKLSQKKGIPFSFFFILCILFTI